jgi:hypothetical protein
MLRATRPSARPPRARPGGRASSAHRRPTRCRWVIKIMVGCVKPPGCRNQRAARSWTRLCATQPRMPTARSDAGLTTLPACPGCAFRTAAAEAAATATPRRPRRDARRSRVVTGTATRARAAHQQPRAPRSRRFPRAPPTSAAPGMARRAPTCFDETANAFFFFDLKNIKIKIDLIHNRRTLAIGWSSNVSSYETLHLLSLILATTPE